MRDNNTNTKKTTFWKFLSDNTIEIPIIQRDYAQGRVGKEYLRKNFLSDLKDALDKGEELKLDFVYGSKDGNKLNPLDGQQRLTTLWLLHWYIALRSGNLNKNLCEKLKRFTYETRISSREFCKELCKTKNFQNYYFGNIVEYIKNQTWFYSAWKQDPTIQSMLRMLGGTKNEKGEPNNDGIEQVFNCNECSNSNDEKKCKYDRYWDILAEEHGKKCPIIFYYLPLNEFKLTDDLYIKMNARGEQLTSFENFKADLIEYITKQKDNKKLPEEERKKWETLLDEENGIPIKMDADWTNIFWGNKSQDYKIDEIYFAFLNRFFWNELFIAKDDKNEYILDIGKGDENSTQENNNLSYKYLNNSGSGRDDYDTTISYKGLDVYRYFHEEIPYTLFSDLHKILDNYLKYQKQINNLQDLFNCVWDKDFKYIPIYLKESETNKNIEIRDTNDNKIWKVSHLSQVQRIVFFAICKYYKDEDNQSDVDKESLERWMRVVWNLVSGEDHEGRPQIRSTSAMRKAMNFINTLDSHRVYEYLIKVSPFDNPSDFESRCNEEIAKAIQILDEDGNLRIYNEKYTWEDRIKKAESYSFFKGAIRFLFQDAEGNVTEDSWKDFDKKWGNAQNYFDEEGNGVTTQYKTDNVLLRTLISYFEKKEHFLAPYYDNSHWRSIILHKKLSSPVCSLLTKECIGDFNEYTPICNDFKLDLAQKQLVKTNLIDNLPKDGYYMEDDLKLHVYYGHRETTDIYLGDSVHENHILANLIDELDKLDKRIISCDQRLKKTHFFFGRNINFKYKNHYFQWWGEPNENALDVYLLRENEDYCIKNNQVSEKTPDEDKYFCFRVKEEMSTEDFMRELNLLIQQACAKKAGKDCYKYCPNEKSKHLS